MPSSFEIIKKDGKVFVFASEIADIREAIENNWRHCTHNLLIDKKTNLIKKVFLFDDSKHETRFNLGYRGYWGDCFLIKFNMTEEEEEEFDPTDYKLDGNYLIRIEK